MQGDLSEFTMAELLQLFALAERTGILTVTTPTACSRVLLESGRVIGIGLPDFNVHTEITACELMPTRSGASIGSITPTPGSPSLSFVVRNLIEPERWELFVRRCLEQQVYPNLTSSRGSFEVTIERTPFCPLAVSLSVQQMVLDGSRWQSEMSELRQEGFYLESRFKRGEETPGQQAVSALDWLIWSALGEPQTVERIAQRVGVPDLDALGAVRRLLASGAIYRASV